MVFTTFPMNRFGAASPFHIVAKLVGRTLIVMQWSVTQCARLHWCGAVRATRPIRLALGRFLLDYAGVLAGFARLRPYRGGVGHNSISVENIRCV